MFPTYTLTSSQSGKYDFTKLKKTLGFEGSDLPQIFFESGEFEFVDMDRYVKGREFLSGLGRKAYATKGVKIRLHNCRLKPHPDLGQLPLQGAPRVLDSGPSGGINELIITHCEAESMGGIRFKQARSHPITGRCAQVYVAFNDFKHIDGRVFYQGKLLTWHEAADIANQIKHLGRTDWKANMFNWSFFKMRRGDFKNEIINETGAVRIEFNSFTQNHNGKEWGPTGDMMNFAYPAEASTLVRDEKGRVIDSGISVRFNKGNGPFMGDPQTQDCPSTAAINDPGKGDPLGTDNIFFGHNYMLGGSNMLYQVASPRGKSYWGWNTAANYTDLEGWDDPVHYMSGGFGHLLFQNSEPEFYNNRSYCMRRRYANGQYNERRNDYVLKKGYDPSVFPMSGDRANMILWPEDQKTDKAKVAILSQEYDDMIASMGHTIGCLPGKADIPAEITRLMNPPAYHYETPGETLIYEEFETLPNYPVSSTSNLLSAENGLLKSEIPVKGATNQYRDELSLNEDELNLHPEKSYGIVFATFAPSESFHPEETTGTIVFQVHTKTLNQNVNPPVALKILGGKWYLDIKGDSRPFSEIEKPLYEISEEIPIADFTPGQWDAWKILIGYGKNGFVEVWQDGAQLFKKEFGHVGFNDDSAWVKMGMYCPLLRVEAHRSKSESLGIDSKEMYHAFFSLAKLQDKPGDDIPTEPGTISIEELEGEFEKLREDLEELNESDLLQDSKFSKLAEYFKTVSIASLKIAEEIENGTLE